jgi:hypothetical protein
MEEEKLTKQCPYCGEEISIHAKKCKYCREWLVDDPVIHQPAQPASQPQVVVTEVERKSNGVGTAGFVIALICACLSWLPGVNAILWFIGLMLSFFGMFKRPRGLAIIGFLISILDIIIIVMILGAIGVMFA